MVSVAQFGQGESVLSAVKLVWGWLAAVSTAPVASKEGPTGYGENVKDVVAQRDWVASSRTAKSANELGSMSGSEIAVQALNFAQQPFPTATPSSVDRQEQVGGRPSQCCRNCE